MRRLSLVASGGAVGAGLRRALTVGGPDVAAWPMATLVANLVGALCLGLLLGWLRRHPERERLLRPLLGVGLLGALTTMSTFALELVTLWRAELPIVAVGYGMVTVAVGLALAGVGLRLGASR